MVIEGKDQWKAAPASAFCPSFWDLKLNGQIGRDLRRQYEQMMDEPLPERLALLLGRLEDLEG